MRFLWVVLLVGGAAVGFVLVRGSQMGVGPLPSVESVRLPRRPVRFVVLSGERPVPGARILIEGAGGVYETDARGTVTIDVPQRDVVFCVQHSGHYCAVEDVPWWEVNEHDEDEEDIMGDDDDLVVVSLEPISHADGRVVLEDGTPVRRALVRVVDQEEDGRVLEGAQVTDTEGWFGVAAEPPFVIEAVAPGYAPTFHRVTGEVVARSITVRLGRGATIEGRALDVDGEPAAGAAVFAAPEHLAWMLNRSFFERFSFGDLELDFSPGAATGPDGRYRLLGIQPGRYVVAAFRARSGTAKTEEFDVPAGARVTRDLRFPPQAGLLVKLVTLDGLPARAAEEGPPLFVDLDDPDGFVLGRWPYLVRDDGTYLFVDVPLGPYRLRVTEGGYDEETIPLVLDLPGLHARVVRMRKKG